MGADACEKRSLGFAGVDEESKGIWASEQTERACGEAGAGVVRCQAHAQVQVQR